MVAGPIIVIEDDKDDQDIIEEALKELKIPNETVLFFRCADAFDYLKTHANQPFIIFCDINLPDMNGIDFKRKIDGDPQLRRKSIPFVFFSTSADKQFVEEAYTVITVQGYFQKANSYAETKENVRTILEYWKICKHPNAL